MPLAEMACGVAGFAQQMRDGDLLRAHGPVGGERAVAIRMAPRQHTAAGGRARRVRRVKTIQPQSVGGHLVEDRRLQMRVSVIARLLPAMVVAHQQDDVRALRRLRRSQQEKRSRETRQNEAVVPVVTLHTGSLIL